MKYLKEITVWDKCDFNVPNHTYIFNDKGQNVGYIKTGTKEEIMYPKPSVGFSKKNRRFVELKNRGLLV